MNCVGSFFQLKGVGGAYAESGGAGACGLDPVEAATGVTLVCAVLRGSTEEVIVRGHFSALAGDGDMGVGQVQQVEVEVKGKVTVETVAHAGGEGGTAEKDGIVS